MYQSNFDDQTLAVTKADAIEWTAKYFQSPRDEEAGYYCKKYLEELYTEIGAAYFFKYCGFDRKRVDLRGLIARLDVYGLDLLANTAERTIRNCLACGMAEGKAAMNEGYILPAWRV